MKMPLACQQSLGPVQNLRPARGSDVCPSVISFKRNLKTYHFSHAFWGCVISVLVFIILCYLFICIYFMNIRHFVWCSWLINSRLQYVVDEFKGPQNSPCS
jgi:hypothetical protein